MTLRDRTITFFTGAAWIKLVLIGMAITGILQLITLQGVGEATRKASVSADAAAGQAKVNTQLIEALTRAREQAAAQIVQGEATNREIASRAVAQLIASQELRQLHADATQRAALASVVNNVVGQVIAELRAQRAGSPSFIGAGSRGVQ